MPPGVVTVTSTVPVPAGEVAVICVELLTTTPVAALVPKSTAVAPVRLVPVMVTLGATGRRSRRRADAGHCGTGPVGPPNSSSRLALVAAPSVKSRLPPPELRIEVGPLNVADLFDGPPATVAALEADMPDPAALIVGDIQ